jgi:hypothetical protein
MNDTLFGKIKCGDCFFYSGLSLCIKTQPENMYDADTAVLGRFNVLSLADRRPISVRSDESILQVKLVKIGGHLWFPAYYACEGGMGPFEIKMVHDETLDLDFIPVRAGIRFAGSDGGVTGLMQGIWTFVHHPDLVRYQRTFQSIALNS